MDNIVELTQDETKDVVGGATAIEYGLIAASIAIAAISAATAVGGKLSSNFNHVSNSVAK